MITSLDHNRNSGALGALQRARPEALQQNCNDQDNNVIEADQEVLLMETPLQQGNEMTDFCGTPFTTCAQWLILVLGDSNLTIKINKKWRICFAKFLFFPMRCHHTTFLKVFSFFVSRFVGASKPLRASPFSTHPKCRVGWPRFSLERKGHFEKLQSLVLSSRSHKSACRKSFRWLPGTKCRR